MKQPIYKTYDDLPLFLNAAIQDILDNFVGNILDEYTFQHYCNSVYRDVTYVVDNVMMQVFDEPANEEDNNE